MLLALLGTATVVYGLWLIYPPAAFIGGGLGLAAAGLTLIDLD